MAGGITEAALQMSGMLGLLSSKYQEKKKEPVSRQDTRKQSQRGGAKIAETAE
jgi:hypothetical protein